LLDGKEGVDGSSPVRGLCKSAAYRGFVVQADVLVVERADESESSRAASGWAFYFELPGVGVSRAQLRLRETA
jgi:hypothetical protein